MADPIARAPARDRRVQSSGFGAWIDHHLYSFVASLGRFFRKPWSTLLTIGVMAVALAATARPVGGPRQPNASRATCRPRAAFRSSSRTTWTPRAPAPADTLRKPSDIAVLELRTPDKACRRCARNRGWAKRSTPWPPPAATRIRCRGCCWSRVATTSPWPNRCARCRRRTWSSTTRSGARGWTTGCASAVALPSCSPACSGSGRCWSSATPCGWTSSRGATRSACCNCWARATASSAARSCTWRVVRPGRRSAALALLTAA